MQRAICMPDYCSAHDSARATSNQCLYRKHICVRGVWYVKSPLFLQKTTPVRTLAYPIVCHCMLHNPCGSNYLRKSVSSRLLICGAHMHASLRRSQVSELLSRVLRQDNGSGMHVVDITRPLAVILIRTTESVVRNP